MYLDDWVDESHMFAMIIFVALFYVMYGLIQKKHSRIERVAQERVKCEERAKDRKITNEKT